jgi:hypothetical protein
LITSVLLTLAYSACAAEEVPNVDPVELAQALDGETFKERHQSTILLRRLGRKAHPAIIAAAKSGSPEARTRALAILEEQFQSHDADVKASAKESLEQVAKGGGTAGRLAQSILTPPPPPSINPAMLRRGALQMRRIQIQGGFQIGGQQQLPPAVRRYSITLNDNGRTIRVKGSEEGIQMEITETNKEGRRVTNKYQAKNAAELKANHPEAHAIFDDMRKKFGLRDPNP